VTRKLPDLSRTEAAIKAFDGAAELDKKNELAQAVGRTYGQDTIDRNDPETCTALVRPGPPTPSLGETDVSFVRRMVRKWREEQ